MHLTDFPAGEKIFLDANCLIYHFTGTHPSCALLLERARRRDIRAVTAATTVAEAHHRLMLLETAQRLGRRVSNLPGFLKGHPELIRSLQQCERAFEQFERFRIRVLPVTHRVLVEGRRISHELGLLTNDGIVVATMRLHQLVHLASNDADFARVPGITLWRP